MTRLATLAGMGDAIVPRDGGEPWRMYPPLALPDAERRTLDWLAGHARPGDGVLSWRGLALYVPARTPGAAGAGRWGETPHCGKRLRKVYAFDAPNTPARERGRLPDEVRERFASRGRGKRPLGGAYGCPDADQRLRRVFTAGGLARYEGAP